jgi:hypothetical protein
MIARKSLLACLSLGVLVSVNRGGAGGEGGGDGGGGRGWRKAGGLDTHVCNAAKEDDESRVANAHARHTCATLALLYGGPARYVVGGDS